METWFWLSSRKNLGGWQKTTGQCFLKQKAIVNIVLSIVF